MMISQAVATVHINIPPWTPVSMIYILYRLPCTFYSDYRLIAAKQIPDACLSFAREKKEELIEKGIVQNFMTHLITLCDIGLINPTVLKNSMTVVYTNTTTTTS